VFGGRAMASSYTAPDHDDRNDPHSSQTGSGEMLRLGLTGGIACGKSTIAAMLVERGAHYLQADTLAHRLYEPGTPTYGEVVRRFGGEILDADGRINRTKLANVVFPNRIGELNSIVHPAVMAAQKAWMKEIERIDPKGVAVVEAALLLEAGAAKDFDKIMVVTCDLDRKVERFAQRTGSSPEVARGEVERRSAAQYTDAQKAGHADYVIENSGTLEDAARQVEQVWKRLKLQPPPR
jgi:dephospho-CoA kinase